MNLSTSVQIPKPGDFGSFQRKCKVLFELVLDDPNAKEFGTSGQGQDGIDILGVRRSAAPDHWVGIQCKLTIKSRKIKKGTIRKEAQKALAITPALKELIVVTTAEDDTEMDREAAAVKPITKPTVSNRRDRRLQKGELDKLLKAAGKTRNPFILPVVRFALETAMRRGEILALRVRDVDIERCTATIRMSKNGHARTIPLSSLAVAILETTIAVMSKNDKASNERIFPITALALRLAWVRLTKRAKIDDLHFHDLRHEAISRFFEKGLTVPEVASISGHRDIRMLLRYAHADKGKLAEKLNTGD